MKVILLVVNLTAQSSLLLVPHLGKCNVNVREVLKLRIC